MTQTKNGFVFNITTKEVVLAFFVGYLVELGDGCDYYYGTKESAVVYGLAFKSEED